MHLLYQTVTIRHTARKYYAMPRKPAQRSRRISVTDPLTGKRHQPRVYGKNAAELRDREAAKRAEILSGAYHEPEKMPVAQWMWHWFGRYRQSPASRGERERAIRLHIEPERIGSIPLGRLRRAHVQQWIDEHAAKGYARNTLSGWLTTLNMALSHAVRMGLVATNPCSDIDLPSGKRRNLTVWSEDETRRFLAAVRDEPDAAFWTLATTLGIRRGELLALRWGDVSWQDGILSIQRTMTRTEDRRWMIGELAKTDAGRRDIPLGRVGMDALRQHRAQQVTRRLSLADVWVDSGAIFDDGLGNHQRGPDVVRHRFAALIERHAMPKIRIHDMRHGAATTMLRSGLPVSTVARILGHASPAVTLNIYSHVLAHHLTDATDVIDRLYGS